MIKPTTSNPEGSKPAGRPVAVLLAIALAVAACDGANQGVQIGTGQRPDPVVVDFPIAYVKSPLAVDDQGDFVQPDLRELATFDFGADLYVKDRASPSTDPVNVTGELMQGLAAVKDVEISYDGSVVVFAMLLALASGAVIGCAALSISTWRWTTKTSRPGTSGNTASKRAICAV